MGENLRDIDKLFRDAIEGHEEIPSGKVWNSIDTNLDKSNIIQIKRKYNNFKRIAIAVILLLSATVIYQLQTKKSRAVKEVLVNNKKVDQAPVDNNTGNEKINPYLDGDKIINANERANKEIRNAGKEAPLVSSEEQNELSVNARNVGDEKNNVGIRSKNSFSKDSNINDQVAKEYAASITKRPIKKSSTHKTKIVVRNGRAEEIGVEDDSRSPQDMVAVNDLAALEKIKATKIIPDKANNDVIKINARNNSPEVVARYTAKSKKDKSKRPFHFSVLPFYAPQYSYTRIEDNHTSPVAPPPGNNRREEIRRAENHETAASFGVLVEVPVSRKWSIQSGITYLKKSITIEPKKIFARLEDDGKVKYRFDCSSGYTFVSPKSAAAPAIGDSVSAVSSTNKLHYVSVPLAVSYRFSAGKFDVRPTAGGGINFLVKQKIETEVLQGNSKTSQTIKNIHGLKSTYYNALAAIAVDYNINKKIALTITPTASFALSAINKDAVVKSYPNSVGVAAGIKVKF